MAINTIIIVNNNPNVIFNTLLIRGFNIIDRKIIKGGIVKTSEAINNIIGLFNTFSPLIKLSTLPGVYNSK